MPSVDTLLQDLKSLADEHHLPLVGVAAGTLRPILVGDVSKLAYPSLVRRLFDSADDIDRLRAQLSHVGSPTMYSQGTTTGSFGLIGQDIVYGIFRDTSDSAVAQYRFATLMHATLTSTCASENDEPGTEATPDAERP